LAEELIALQLLAKNQEITSAMLANADPVATASGSDTDSLPLAITQVVLCVIRRQLLCFSNLCW
jgi:hypothetical protein